MMGIYSLNSNRNLTKGNQKQRFVAFYNGCVRKGNRTLGTPLNRPHSKFGKTEDEILNNIIKELQYPMREKNQIIN